MKAIRFYGKTNAYLNDIEALLIDGYSTQNIEKKTIGFTLDIQGAKQSFEELNGEIDKAESLIGKRLDRLMKYALGNGSEVSQKDLILLEKDVAEVFDALRLALQKTNNRYWTGTVGYIVRLSQ